MNIVHMHFEVVISCKLLMTKMALCHWAVWIVSHLVSDEHFLQAKSQVTNVTLKRLFSCVCPLMFIQAPLLAEGLAAL